MLSTDLLHHYRRLGDSLFTVIDLETTGGNSQSDRITEIAVVRGTLASGVQERLSHLMNPQTDIPEKIIRLTGITPAMVREAPTAAKILPQYRSWLEGGILTGHNVAFDYGFLQAEFARQQQPFSRPAHQRLCTVQLSRLMLADLPSRRLSKLVKHFQFEVGPAHRAAADAEACWLLLAHLLKDILKKKDASLLQRFRREWIPLRIAAKLLGCTCEEGFDLLRKADVPYRLSGRSTHKTPMYRRGPVEDVVCNLQGIQLSLV